MGESIGSTPSSIIELLFGKTVENLSCDNIKALVENRVVESPRLEFKAVSEDTDEGKLAEIIMKSIVGFLNSDVGEGILILGIRGKERAEELTCIPRKLLGRSKDVAESKLRNWVFSYLASIPPMITPPRLIVRVFDCRECGLGGSEGWIALIYVKRTFDALYYSKLDDTAYQRRGSETRRLSLEEALHIVSAKRQPIVIVLMRPKKVEENRVSLELFMHNIGSIPTNVAASLITISKRAYLGRLSPQVKPPALASPSEVLLNVTTYEGIIRGVEDKEKVVLQASVSSPLSLPAFPGANIIVGEIEFSFEGKLSGENSLLIEFMAVTHTELNRTIQRSSIVLNSKMEFFQICKDVITKDYIGKAIFEVTSEKGEYLTYDKEKGIRIERIT